MKYIKQLISIIIVMFALIFITVFLTGGKEIYQFTKIDNIIFIIFLILELISVLLLTYVLSKYCKECAKNIRKNTRTTKTKYEKIMQRRGYVILALSYIISLGLMLLGIISTPHLVSYQIRMMKKILLLLIFVSLALVPLNLFLRKQLIKKIEQSPVKDMQQYIYAHREVADETIKKKYKSLRFLRFISVVYFILIAIMSSGISFLSGVISADYFGNILCMYSAILIVSVLSRIRLPIPTAIFQDDKRYLEEKDYPCLYALTKKAAKTINCVGDIKIAIIDEFNAGIARYNNSYSVQLGAYLINILSEDELFCVLLHEFSHMEIQNNAVNKERDYNNWLQQGIAPHFLSGFTQLLSLYTDTLYVLNYSLFEYASALYCETDADKAMIKYGNVRAAASALLKMKYFHLYQWEKGTYDESAFFASETLEKGFMLSELDDFNQRLKARIEDWKCFAKKEILSRSASHPTLNMRLASFGISSYDLLETQNSDIYNTECKKALSFLEDLIYMDLSESYAYSREQKYLQPMQLLEKWEKSGKPLVAEEYTQIGFALRQLGRNSDALQLYQRAVSEFELPSEICHARYFIGCYLLHKFDCTGLDDIYYAMENNSNYIDEGLDIIGEFCCLTGNQTELERYREKAMELAQKQKDVYSQIGVLTSKDHLSTEHLPDGMLEEILTYINKIDEQAIEAIYLVRKTITADFFTSVFIIKFELTTTEETQERILQKIFSFLDTFSSWQFSLFEYFQVYNVKLNKIKNSCVYHK